MSTVAKHPRVQVAKNKVSDFIGALTRVPQFPWLVVGLTMITVTGFLWALLVYISIFWVHVDERVYFHQAISLSNHFRLLTPSDPYYLTWGQLNALLVALVIKATSLPKTFVLMHMVSTMIMVSTGVPVYLAGRLLTKSTWVIWSAVTLSITFPWMLFSSSMMTEVLAYPAFMWMIYIYLRTILQPSRTGDLAFVGISIVAASIRTQLVVGLLAGLVVLLLHKALYDATVERNKRSVRRFLTVIVQELKQHQTIIVIVILGTLLLSVGIVMGPFLALITNYLGIFQYSLFSFRYIEGGLKSLVVDIWAVGLLPLSFGLAWIFATLWRPCSKNRHAFALLTIVTVSLFVYQIGFATANTQNIQMEERYIIYILPLLYLCFALLLAETRKYILHLLLGTLITVAIITFIPLPVNEQRTLKMGLDTYLFISHATQRVLRPIHLSVPIPFVGYCTVVIAALLLWGTQKFNRLSTVFTKVVTLCLVTLNIAALLYIIQGPYHYQGGRAGIWRQTKAWIDRAMPHNEKAIVVNNQTPFTGGNVWSDTVVDWNKRLVNPMYTLSGPLTGSIIKVTTKELNRDFNHGIVYGPTKYKYIVMPRSDPYWGIYKYQPIAEDWAMFLYQVQLPAKADWLMKTPDQDHIRQKESAVLRVYKRAFRSKRIKLFITLQADEANNGIENIPVMATLGRSVRQLNIKPHTNPETFTIQVDKPQGNYQQIRLKNAGNSWQVFSVYSVAYEPN